jgi:hypothetical protein
MSIYSVVKELITKDPITKEPLPKSCGAANGKLETSRGRKSPAQEYMGALRECRRKQHVRMKREPLNPLYRKGKRATRVCQLFSYRYRQ